MANNPHEADYETMSGADRAESAKKRILYDLTSVFSNSDRSIDVELGRNSYIALDGSYISVSQSYGDGLSDEQLFRFQVDTTAHEVAHDNHSDLKSKQKFSKKNDVAPKTAGAIINIIEDRFIDYHRTQENIDQKRALAHKYIHGIESGQNPKLAPVDEQSSREAQLLYGFMQVTFLGFPIVNDTDALDDDVMDFLTWARQRVAEVIHMTPENAKKAASSPLTNSEAMARSQQKREELAQEVFDVMMGHMDNPEKADDAVAQDQPFVSPDEIPDDVDIRPMTDEERAEFDKMKQDMPTMDMPEQGDESGEGEDQQGSGSSGSSGGSGEERGDSNSGSSGNDGEESGDETEDGSSGDNSEGDSETGDESDESSGGSSDGESDCPCCGGTLIKRPRHEVENPDGLLSEYRTDGGVDMVYVCADCGEVVDPETGEHTGSGDESGQQDDESGESGADGDEGDESGESGADGDENGESGADDDGDNESGESGADDDGDNESGPESNDDGAAQNPFSEEDNTTYDNARHDVRQYTPEELKKARATLSTLAKNKDVKAALGLDSDDDVSEVESRWKRQFQRIEIARNADSDSMHVRRTGRDERVAAHPAVTPSDEIRKEVESGTLKNDIEEAFRQLKTRNRPVPSEFGDDLDIDNIITNRAIGTNVQPNYTRMQRMEKGDRAVGIALDMSGSMHERKAKVALGAVYAATDIIGDKFLASAFMTGGRGSSGIVTPLITAPDEEFDWTHLDGLTTGSSTPTASGILDVKDLLSQASRPEKLLIVVTDGKPNVSPNGNSGGNEALDAAASAVQEARHEGIKVIGMGVGSSINAGNLSVMFGEGNYFMANEDNMAETLLEIYRQQMKLVQDGVV